MELPSEVCTECGGWGDYLSKGDGKCHACGGTGVDVGVAVLAGYEGDCEKCNGTGVCPACDGRGVRPARDGVAEADSGGSGC
jgi:DnaJ-class molecular chaperone